MEMFTMPEPLACAIASALMGLVLGLWIGEIRLTRSIERDREYHRVKREERNRRRREARKALKEEKEHGLGDGV